MLQGYNECDYVYSNQIYAKKRFVHPLSTSKLMVSMLFKCFFFRIPQCLLDFYKSLLTDGRKNTKCLHLSGPVISVLLAFLQQIFSINSLVNLIAQCQTGSRFEKSEIFWTMDDLKYFEIHSNFSLALNGFFL